MVEEIDQPRLLQRKVLPLTYLQAFVNTEYNLKIGERLVYSLVEKDFNIIYYCYAGIALVVVDFVRITIPKRASNYR